MWIWHPPECQFYKTETESKAGDKCLFPHHEVDEQPNKSQRLLFPTRRESDDKKAVAVAKIVPLLGCVSQDSDALVSQRWKNSPVETRCKVLGAIRKVLFAKSMSSKYPGEEGTIAWENTSQTSTSAKSLRNEIWGRVPWRDWKTRAMCPKQVLEHCQKRLQAQRERQKLHSYSLSEEWVLPDASTKEPKER